MVYRGFTWNLTASETAAVLRVCDEILRVGSMKYLEADAHRLIALARHFREVSPDGTPPTYLYADS